MSINVSFNQLHFNSVKVVEDKEGNVTVVPNFLCPRCGNKNNPRGKKTALVSTSKALVQKDGCVSKNCSERFVMPCCGAVIDLYVAVTKKKGASTQVCISTQPIMPDKELGVSLGVV